MPQGAVAWPAATCTSATDAPGRKQHGHAFMKVSDFTSFTDYKCVICQKIIYQSTIVAKKYYIILLQAAFQISGAPLLSHFTCGLELLCVLCIAMTVSL